MSVFPFRPPISRRRKLLRGYLLSFATGAALSLILPRTFLGPFICAVLLFVMWFTVTRLD